MSSSEAFLNSFSKGLANSLNKPTSSQFFKKRVGVGVWSGRKWIKPPQFYFYNTIYEPTCCKYFSEHKQKETRWWGTLGLRSALRGGSRQANSTCWRQAPGACKPPSPWQFWQGITAFVSTNHRELFSSAQQNTSLSKEILFSNKDKDYMKAFK